MAFSEHGRIHPYLNPEYWDGHMLGRGPVAEQSWSIRINTYSYASKAIDAYLLHRDGPYPLERLSVDEPLNANDHRPGTVFYTRQEALHVSGAPAAVDDIPEVGPFRELVRPTDLGFELFDISQHTDYPVRTKGISEGGITYLDRHRFVVVTPGKVGNGLMPVDEDGLYRLPNHHISNETTANPMDVEWVVGRTRHGAFGGREFLQRINSAILCVEGRGQVEPSIAERLSHAFNRLTPRI